MSDGLTAVAPAVMLSDIMPPLRHPIVLTLCLALVAACGGVNAASDLAARDDAGAHDASSSESDLRAPEDLALTDDLARPPDLVAPADLVAPPAFVVSTLSSPYAVLAGADDLDGDGKVDLVVFNKNDSTVYWHPGNGDGTFQAPRATGVSGDGSYRLARLSRATVADLVVVTSPSSSTTYELGVYRGNGDGTFAAQVPLATPSITITRGGPALADVNGDGRVDLTEGVQVATTTQNGTSGNTVAHLCNADGTFSDVVTSLYYSPSTVPTLRPLVGADYDGDGKVDLLIEYGASTTWQHFLFHGNGAGGFTYNSAQVLPQGLIGQAWAVDVDGDTLADVVYNDGAGMLTVGLGNGTGAALVTSSYGACEVLTVADFDHDGAPDALCASTQASISDVVRLNRGGAFPSASGVTLPVKGLGYVTGDFNGDGKPDLAGVKPTSTIEIYLNQL